MEIWNLGSNGNMKSGFKWIYRKMESGFKWKYGIWVQMEIGKLGSGENRESIPLPSKKFHCASIYEQNNWNVKPKRETHIYRETHRETHTVLVATGRVTLRELGPKREPPHLPRHLTARSFLGAYTRPWVYLRYRNCFKFIDIIAFFGALIRSNLKNLDLRAVGGPK